MNIDAAKVRREQLRWYLILALYNASPNELCEEVIQATMRGIYPDVTPVEVRQQLDYLESRELIKLRKQPDGRWWADLTRVGTDLAEYNIDCQPGIARPEKYWG